MIAFKKGPLLKWWGAVLVLGCVHAPLAAAGPAQGKQLFEAKNCGACHQMSGPVEAVPVAQRSKIKGPPLWFAGSKFKNEWLIAWLEKPTALYRVKYGTLEQGANSHPALSKADAQEVGAYLMSLTDPALKAGAVTAEKLNRRKMLEAEKLFTKKQVCFGCHQYASKQGDIGGFSGPSLVGAGNRLQADWVHALLKDNVRYYPNARMPVYGNQAFEAFTDEELKLLSQYIGNL
ncbi:MAG: c-type cytochrome [Betaproteobacteria bacterium]|nr:c-type cytochrome [Betaproteobacteria bacterium]